MNNNDRRLYKQRAYDGRWMELTRVPDHEQIYVYYTDNKRKVTLIPDKWIITRVFDLEMTIEE